MGPLPPSMLDRATWGPLSNIPQFHQASFPRKMVILPCGFLFLATCKIMCFTNIEFFVGIFSCQPLSKSKKTLLLQTSIKRDVLCATCAIVCSYVMPPMELAKTIKVLIIGFLAFEAIKLIAYGAVKSNAYLE